MIILPHARRGADQPPNRPLVRMKAMKYADQLRPIQAFLFGTTGRRLGPLVVTLGSARSAA
jgi:hypothetical protein